MLIPKSKLQLLLRFASGCALLVTVFIFLMTYQAGASEDEQGSQLRSALKQDLLSLQYGNMLNGGIGGNDVTPTLKRFIRIGMSFDEAIRVLRAANFDVRYPDLKREATDPNRAKDWYGVVGSAHRIIPQFLGRIDVYISLLPASPGDYTVVRGIQGTAFSNML